MLPIDIVREMRKRDKQRGNPKRPYISLDDKAADLALQAAVPDPIEIGDDNENDNNNSDDNLFSTDSDDDNGDNDPNGENDPDDDNDPNDHYSQSIDDEKKKKNKRSKRKTPTSAIRNPRNSHWAVMRTPEEGEAADVLVAIGAEHKIAKFMVMDGLDCVTEIQELSKVTIAVYAKNSKRASA